MQPETHNSVETQLSSLSPNSSKEMCSVQITEFFLDMEFAYQVAWLDGGVSTMGRCRTLRAVQMQAVNSKYLEVKTSTHVVMSVLLFFHSHVN